MLRHLHLVLLLGILAGCAPEVLDNNRLHIVGRITDEAGNGLAQQAILVNIEEERVVLGESQSDQNGQFDFVSLNSAFVEVRFNRTLYSSLNPVEPFRGTYTILVTQKVAAERNNLLDLGEIQLPGTALVKIYFPDLETDDTLEIKAVYTSTDCNVNLSLPEEVQKGSCFPKDSILGRYTGASSRRELNIATLLQEEIRLQYTLNDSETQDVTFVVDAPDKTYQIEK